MPTEFVQKSEAVAYFTQVKQVLLAYLLVGSKPINALQQDGMCLGMLALAALGHAQKQGTEGMLWVSTLGCFGVKKQCLAVALIEVELKNLLKDRPLRTPRQGQAVAPGFLCGWQVVEPSSYVSAQGPVCGVG